MGYIIKSLYKEYFQKSRVFLYPALNIRRGVSVTPIETYICWEGIYDSLDFKLSCLYHLREDDDFKNFEKVKLLNNSLFDSFYQVEEKKGVYVFDLQDMEKDWVSIIYGKYSLISEDYKDRIRKYIGLNNPHLPYVDSFLYPERHFSLYADLMNVKESILREVGELCSKPDMEHETLKLNIKDLQLSFE